MRDALWIHFIDNNGALGAFVRGSSSVHEQDLIVGETWSLIAANRTLAWFDRIDGKSNPVDGLSRKDFRDIWQWGRIYFPMTLLNLLKENASSRLSGHCEAFKLTDWWGETAVT